MRWAQRPAGGRHYRRDAEFVEKTGVATIERGAVALGEIDGPEARGGAEEFEAYQRFAALAFYNAGYAAGKFFVSLFVGHQEFLRGGDFGVER